MWALPLLVTCCCAQFSSVTQPCQTLWPHGLQHARPPCPSPTPRVYSNSSRLSQWCHSTISSSVIPSSSSLHSFPASRSFQMSQLFPSGGQSIRVSASPSVLPMNIQDWFPLGWTGWISSQHVLSRSTLCNPMDCSLRPHRLYPARLLCPWTCPGKNTGVDCHFLLQGIFLTQGSNLCLLHPLHWQVDSLSLVPYSLIAQLVKNPPCNAGDLGLIPGSERSPGEAKGYPLQYSGLENCMDCIVHGVTKRWFSLQLSATWEAWLQLKWGFCLTMFTLIPFIISFSCYTWIQPLNQQFQNYYLKQSLSGLPEMSLLSIQIPGPSHPKSNKPDLNTPYVILTYREVWEPQPHMITRQKIPVTKECKLK